MKKPTQTDEPIGNLTLVADFLPSPAQLANMARTERATLTLTKATLDFFRKEATKEHVSYNLLIRTALDEYIRRAHPLNSSLETRP